MSRLHGPDKAACDLLISRLDSPLLVVTTASRDQRAGCLIGFHTQCSIEPIRYAVWLSKANFTYRVALFATHLALHLLDAADRELAELFGGTSGDEIDKFELCSWTPGPAGVPLLTQCPNRIVLERATMWDDGSDHGCFVGTPIESLARGELTPMRLSLAHDIPAGHAAQERVTPATLNATDAR